MALRAIKPTQTLPAIVAVTGMRDFGPSEGEGSTCCPHCGARGRYVWYFICADGSKRGAMRGCIQLFPQERGNSRYARLIQEAFNRQQKAQEENKRLASWWQEMITAAETFGASTLEDHTAIEAAKSVLHTAIQAAESRRQGWLSRNGYSRRYR